MTAILKQSLITVLLVSRWFGLTPVKWHLQQLRVSKGFSIYGALLFCLIATAITNETFSIILALFQYQHIDFEKNHTKIVLVQIMLKELILFGYVAFKGPQRMAVMIEVLDQLEKIKEKRVRYKSEKREKKTFYYFIVSYMILLVVVQLNRFIYDLYNGIDNVLDYIKLFTLTFIVRYASTISSLNFVLVALLIHTLLSSINEDLEEIFKDNVPPSNVILYKKSVPVLANYNINPTIDCFGLTSVGTFGDEITDKTTTDERIRSISRTYINYCCLARKLNDSEDIVLLLYVFKLTFNMASSLFNALKHDDYVTSGVSVIRVLATFLHILVALTMGTQLMLLVEPSYRAQVELRKMTLLISKALNQALERNQLDQMNELRHLLKMMHLNRPVYSAFGVFNIGRPLVTAVLSGIATMLVMMQ